MGHATKVFVLVQGAARIPWILYRRLEVCRRADVYICGQRCDGVVQRVYNLLEEERRVETCQAHAVSQSTKFEL